jgi:hypothetical protein
MTGQSEQDSRDRTARTGQPGQDSQDPDSQDPDSQDPDSQDPDSQKRWPGLPGQDSNAELQGHYCRVALSSKTGFRVLCGKGRKKRKFTLFSFALGTFPFFALVFSSRSRARFWLYAGKCESARKDRAPTLGKTVVRGL